MQNICGVRCASTENIWMWGLIFVILFFFFLVRLKGRRAGWLAGWLAKMVLSNGNEHIRVHVLRAHIKIKWNEYESVGKYKRTMCEFVNQREHRTGQYINRSICMCVCLCVYTRDYVYICMYVNECKVLVGRSYFLQLYVPRYSTAHSIPFIFSLRCLRLL